MILLVNVQLLARLQCHLFHWLHLLYLLHNHFLVIIVKKLDHQIFFSVLPMNRLIKLIKCPSWVWILIIIYSVASLLSTSKTKITVYYYGVSIFSEIYYSEVIYGINQLVSPEFFTIARFFTIRKFTNARFHCIWRLTSITLGTNSIAALVF